MSLLKRFLQDCDMDFARRKRRLSLDACNDFDISVPDLSEMHVDDDTELCLKYSDRVVSLCRDFAYSTMQKCRSIRQIEAPVMNGVSLALFINSKKNVIASIVSASFMAEKELITLYNRFKRECERVDVPPKPEVKREVPKKNLSTVKGSDDDLTNDDLFLVEENIVEKQGKSDSKDEFEQILDGILGDNDATSLVPVKVEDDDVFSQSTNVPELDATAIENSEDTPVSATGEELDTTTKEVDHPKRNLDASPVDSEDIPIFAPERELDALSKEIDSEDIPILAQVREVDASPKEADSEDIPNFAPQRELDALSKEIDSEDIPIFAPERELDALSKEVDSEDVPLSAPQSVLDASPKEGDSEDIPPFTSKEVNSEDSEIFTPEKETHYPSFGTIIEKTPEEEDDAVHSEDTPPFAPEKELNKSPKKNNTDNSENIPLVAPKKELHAPPKEEAVDHSEEKELVVTPREAVVEPSVSELGSPMTNSQKDNLGDLSLDTVILDVSKVEDAGFLSGDTTVLIGISGSDTESLDFGEIEAYYENARTSSENHIEEKPREENSVEKNVEQLETLSGSNDTVEETSNKSINDGDSSATEIISENNIKTKNISSNSVDEEDDKSKEGEKDDKVEILSGEKNVCDNLNNKENKSCNIKTRLSKQELMEQIKILDEIWDISDMENDIDNSDISISETDSDEEKEYERPAKRRKIMEKNDENANEIQTSQESTIYPCSITISNEERTLCDEFYYRLMTNQYLKRSPSPALTDSSELLVKPLGKRAAHFSSSSSSDSEASDGDLPPKSDDGGPVLSLDATCPEQDSGTDDDEMAILNGIVDSDSVTSFDDEDDESENEKNEEGKKVKHKKKIRKSIKKEIDENSEWKLDSLLTTRLDEIEDKKETAGKDERVEIKSENDDSGEDDDIFEVQSTASDSSDIQIVDLIMSQDSAGGRGRKNIRAVLSEDTLEQSTIEAGKQEKEHIERLKEKRKNLEKIRETLKEAGLVLDATGDTTIEVNPYLTKRLKAHQTSGVQFMWDACYETVEMIKTHPGAGCVLAHCMGLGKTFQVITLLHTLFKYSDITKTKHVLIICPLSTVYNWENEFSMAVELAKEDTIKYVHSINDQQKCRASRFRVISEWRETGGVLIMCYEAYVSFTANQINTVKKKKLIEEALIDPGPDLLVCDEGHQLKNAKTKRSAMLSQMKTKRRIILTGTPIQNNLQEYYWMVHFVKPNLLGTHKEFMNRFANPIINGQYDDSTEFDIQLMKMRSHVLHSILKNTVQRMEAKELIQYLPNKHDYVLFVKMHPVQVALYKKVMESCNSYANGERRLFSDFTSLRPTWVHPYALYLKDEHETSMKKVPPKKQQKKVVLDILNVEEEVQSQNSFQVGWWEELTPEDYKTNSDYGPKLTIMLSIVEECERVGDKLLIFTQFLLDLDLIEKFLKLRNPSWQHGVNYYRMDGKVNMELRERYCNKFNDKNSAARIFLLTHKVGGLGLNLVSANRVILMEACWNPSFNEQSIFRIYRFGQVKECYIYRLISMGTMEEVLYERSVTKQAVSNRVIDEMQVGRHYKCSDLSALYRCQVDVTEEAPTPKLPVDEVLARLLQKHKNEIFKYHEHQSLLENLVDEELDKDQIKQAWENFNMAKQKEQLPAVPQLPQHISEAQSGMVTQMQVPSTSNIPPAYHTRIRRINEPMPYSIVKPIRRSSIDQQQHENDLQDVFLNLLDLAPSERQPLQNQDINWANVQIPQQITVTRTVGNQPPLLPTINQMPAMNTPSITTTTSAQISQTLTIPNNLNQGHQSALNLNTRQVYQHNVKRRQSVGVEQKSVPARFPEQSVSVERTSFNVSNDVSGPKPASGTATQNKGVVMFNSAAALPKQDGVIEID